jgi:hypothetical protein
MKKRLSKEYFKEITTTIKKSVNSDNVRLSVSQIKTYGEICRLEGMKAIATGETVKYLINEKLKGIAKGIKKIK